ncbi:P-loop containing nucleoside triphosphate hydrolase protein [Sporodiniella umbellata]|nr:P-loop containing nucleoside triphosphate hydrolase protein [Sporodiniella umbellata]
MNKAARSAPSIVMLRDLNALAKDEKSQRLISILLKEINKIQGSVCVIGLARQLSSLPDSFKRTDIFKQHIAIPIPTMLERIDIIKAMLKEEGINGAQCEEYASQVGLRTSGYVAKDLKRLIKETRLKSKRRPKKQDITEQFASLSLSSHISWDDFEYALGVYCPSQQVEHGSTVLERDWKEWGGYKTIRDKVRQAILLPIQQPQAFQKLGIKPPSGLLLYGPSGSGKTALIQALITESKMNVIAIKGPEIFSKYLGETEEKIRRLFASAKRMAPCIVFVDEMDAIGSKRGTDLSGGVNERVLSTLLNEMDGVEERQGVVVIGCTNRPDQIDDAILRPGRLDQLIYLGLPTEEDRVDIIRSYINRMSVSKDVDPRKLGKQTEFCTGADIENLFREAGTLALRKNMEAQHITKEDFDEVIVSICERAEDLVLQGKLDLYERFLHDHSLK